MGLFVFWCYFDYGVIFVICVLYVQICNEVVKCSNGVNQQCDYVGYLQVCLFNIKFGCGGICEIEFVVQVFQFICGGQDFGLCVWFMLEVFWVVLECGLIDVEVVVCLIEVYCFLCQFEYCLQYIEDVQMYNLLGLLEDQLCVVCMMGFDDYVVLVIRFEVYQDEVV